MRPSRIENGACEDRLTELNGRTKQPIIFMTDNALSDASRYIKQ